MPGHGHRHVRRTSRLQASFSLFVFSDAQAGSVISQASRVVCGQVSADVQCLHWSLTASSSPRWASMVVLLVDVQS